MELLDSLPTLLKSFWYIAIPTSLIFLIQTVITFSGLDVADGFDTDFDAHLHDGGDFQLFSLRNLINFLLGFSWTGISFYSTLGEKPVFLIVTSFVVGVLFVLLFFFVIKQVQKLAEDNSFKITNTLNKTAEVYLTIPEKKSGKGKIMISVNGAFHELEAMTENDRIPSGSSVKVVKIENNNLLIVETI
ncbi:MULTISPECIES: NfeD family protein [Flavobacterium]|uniref:NfeD family protein n=1 Tax=Flavobacterium TaxID=237 RepID=UPI0025A6080F|nr:NfeD family protein [Flavobacterium panacagri]